MRGVFARAMARAIAKLLVSLPFTLELCVVALGVLSGVPAYAAPDDPTAALPPMRRFALVMGANGGGEGTVRLRYAASDARSFSSLLTELGGVRSEDLVLLLDPGLSSFRSATEKLRASAVAANSAGQRCEFVLYFSGHSDEEGLMLGREKLTYSDLRSAIERVPAAVRVAILDSCSSGSLTRTKGGSSRPAFLFDASTDLRGHAYITSSSEAEAAQESDKIGGSFFTHYLVSALRGAADTNGEGKVTLNEAYAYAFRETLASTENTEYGPQHPAYEISLAGSGDLVFTDLRSSSSGLSFDEALAGAIYVRDAKGVLAVELDKAAGENIEIGLPSGKYYISLIQGSARSQADVTVNPGGRARLVPGNFRPVAPEAASARGIAVVAADPTAPPLSFVSFDTTLLPDFSQGLFPPNSEDKVIAISMLWGKAHDVQGIQASGLLNAASGEVTGLQCAIGANVVQAGLRGVQLACYFNSATGDSSGAQVALVNVAENMTGVQFGLVNISKRIDGIPIGLLNIEEEGVFSPQIWYETNSHVRAGLQWGTHSIYSLLSFGADVSGSSLVLPSLGAGLGGRIVVGPVCGNFDLSWRWIFGMTDVAPSSRLSCRMFGGFPEKKTGVIAGLELEGFMPGLSLEDDGSSVSSFRVEPRFLIGVKF